MHTDLASADKVWVPTEDRGNQKKQTYIDFSCLGWIKEEERGALFPKLKLGEPIREARASQ